MSLLRLSLAMVCASCFGAASASAEDLFHNFGPSDLTTTPAPIVSPTPDTITESPAPATDLPAATLAFGHHRGGCCGNGGYGANFPAAYYAYNTYQPQPRYASGYLGPSGGGYYGNYVYPSPNPYGYYQNGWYWGSSGPTYRGPFPVWNSPSGIYDYRYLGWGSYGWGGWGGTGPAGWGYQGGFYW